MRAAAWAGSGQMSMSLSSLPCGLRLMPAKKSGNCTMKFVSRVMAVALNSQPLPDLRE